MKVSRYLNSVLDVCFVHKMFTKALASAVHTTSAYVTTANLDVPNNMWLQVLCKHMHYKYLLETKVSSQAVELVHFILVP